MQPCIARIKCKVQLSGKLTLKQAYAAATSEEAFLLLTDVTRKGNKEEKCTVRAAWRTKKRATELQQSYYGYAVESAAGSPRNKLSVQGIPVLKKVRRKFAKKVQQ
jgi:hypothetical protein